MTLFTKQVRAETVIPASPSQVWGVLTDPSGYAAWNPVIVPVEGEYRVGTKLVYDMKGPGDKSSRVTSRVVRMTSGVELNQRGGIPCVLTFDHHWLLEPSNGGTRVTQYEIYRGVGVPFWNPSWVEAAYRDANEGLKNRVLELSK